MLALPISYGMKYTTEIYASALREVIGEAKPSKRDAIVKRFVQAVIRRGDARKLPTIARELEQDEVHARGGRMVEVESVSALRHNMSKLKNLFKEADHIETRINPELIAGTRITIDGERELDFSLARQLNKMFR